MSTINIRAGKQNVIQYITLIRFEIIVACAFEIIVACAYLKLAIPNC